MSPEGASYTPRRQMLIVMGILVALLAAAFVAGRFSAPVRVEERVRVEQVEKQVVVVQEKVRVERVAAKAEVTAKRSITTETVSKDGERRRETITESGRQATEVTGESTSRELQAASERITSARAETARVVDRRRPDWRVGALVGARIGELHLTATPPYVAPIQFGAQVQRRVLGPVWAGAFGLSDGTVGLSLSLEL